MSIINVKTQTPIKTQTPVRYGKKSCSTTLQTCPETGTFEGYASMFHVVDSHGDVVQKGAFSRTLAHWRHRGQWPKMLWQHDPTQVIGVWTDMVQDNKGLYVKGRLLLDVEKAREAQALLMAKAIDSLSIGYQTRHSDRGMFEGKSAVFLTELDLLEVSLVTFPSNPAAKVLFAKNDPSMGAPAEMYKMPGHIISEINAFCAHVSAY